MKASKRQSASIEPALWLPFPNTKEVESFRLLYKQEFGVELTTEEALSVATRLLHIHYVFYSAPRAPETR